MIRSLALLVALVIAAPLEAQVTITPSSGVSGSGVVTSSQLLAPDGLASAPPYSFATSPTTGLYLPAANNPSISISGNRVFNFTSTSFDVLNDSGAIRLGVSADVSLFRDLANTLALRNGVNAQTFRVYNTYTDAANYERLDFRWSAGAAIIGTSNSGTGVAPNLVLSAADILVLNSASTNRWQVNGSGHFLAATDNTYDIGASGATRPRNIFAAGEVIASTGMYPGEYAIMNSGGRFSWSGRGNMYAAADGVIQLTNIAATGFTRLILGTNDANGVGLSKNGGALRVTDGNSDTNLEVLEVNLLRFGDITGPFLSRGTGSPEGVLAAPIGSIYTNVSGGAATTLYIKTSGAGNTGWVAK